MKYSEVPSSRIKYTSLYLIKSTTMKCSDSGWERFIAMLLLSVVQYSIDKHIYLTCIHTTAVIFHIATFLISNIFTNALTLQDKGIIVVTFYVTYYY